METGEKIEVTKEVLEGWNTAYKGMREQILKHGGPSLKMRLK